MRTISWPSFSGGSGGSTARPRSIPLAYRSWIKIASFVAVLAVLIAGGSFWWEPEPIEVSVATPAFEDIDLSVTTMGKVIPVDEFQARASFPGMIEKVYVQLGETVHAGQMLIKMKDPFAMSRVISASAGLQTTEVSSQNVQQGGSQEDLIGLQGEWKRALQEQASAENALATMKQLKETGSASGAEVYGTEQRLQAANTAVETLRARMTKRYSASDKASWGARVSQAKAALDAEKTSFANANITSPINGVVFLSPVAAYDFVGMGAPLIQIADLNHVRIRAFFDEPDIGKLHVGQTVTVKWDGRPEQSWMGRIEHAPLAATSMGSRTVGECMISVDNARGELLPNTNVNISVPVERKKNVLTIPREALHTDGKVDYVFRFNGKKLVRTQVNVSLVNLGRVEVTRGITVTDTIALHTGDNSDLKDGLKVRVTR